MKSIVFFFVLVILVSIVHARPFHQRRSASIRNNLPLVGMKRSPFGEEASPDPNKLAPPPPPSSGNTGGGGGAGAGGNAVTDLAQAVTDPKTLQPLTTSEIEVQYKGQPMPEKVQFGQCIPFQKQCQAVEHVKYSALAGCIVYNDDQCQDKQHSIPAILPPNLPIHNVAELGSSLSGSYLCYKATDQRLIASIANPQDLAHYMENLKKPEKLLQNLPTPDRVGTILTGGVMPPCSSSPSQEGRMSMRTS